MLLIGHSMGGLLSSIVTRDYRGASSALFYTPNAHSLKHPSMGKHATEELLQTPPLTCINRVIFIATPHRGSKYADNWIGQLVSHFIRLPQKVIGIDPQHYRHELTQLGKNLLNVREGLDGIQRLKYHNPALLFNLSRPRLPYVTYHSIIGNRGFPGAIENSSDGVVTYSSSHLKEAASEKIVPAWHSAQKHHASLAEISRILQLHLLSK